MKEDKNPTRKLTCRTVGPGRQFKGKQEQPSAPGISAESVGAQKIHLQKRRSFITLAGGAVTAAVFQRALGASRSNVDKLILPTDTEVRTGGSRMVQIDGGYQVWTKKVGDAPIKVLLLHGGPGLDHSYFECIEDFLPPNQIEFYYYDQLDSTNSDKPDDPRLWTVERFCQEVEAVRKGLGLEQFYLLGHSWGGLLAIEYALAYPQHLKGLIISNMAASIPSFEKYFNQLRAALPDEVKRVLERYEKSGQYEAPEYKKIVFEQLYDQYICRLKPWPEPITRDFRNWNQKVYNYLQGPNELIATGAYKDWDRWADLPRIGTKTLVMGAKYDEMSAEDLRKMAELMPNARAWISDKGSHFAMYDDQLAYFTELLTFLKSA
jgi:proline iminopeptidase